MADRYIPVYDEQGEIIDCNPTDCPPILSISDLGSNKTYQASELIQVSGTIALNKEIVLKAGDAVILQPGFSIGPNSTLLATIENCSNTARHNNIPTSSVREVFGAEKINTEPGIKALYNLSLIHI